jgi:hypothetical protein
VSGFSRDEASRLIELLGTELELFGQVRVITRKQKELLDADDIDGFDRSLDSRQELIEKINGLHQESDILMQSYISHHTTGGGKKQSEVETAAGKLRDIISQCVADDEANAAKAKEKAEDYVQQIDKMSLNKKSIGAYVQDIPNKPEHFDRKT